MDVFVYIGVIVLSGDCDCLFNVILEVMLVGVLVVMLLVVVMMEVIYYDEMGLVVEVMDVVVWVELLCVFVMDDVCVEWLWLVVCGWVE